MQRSKFVSRRSAMRRGVRMCCVVRSALWDGAAPYVVTDISSDGAWLSTELPLDAGDQVVLTFRPPRWPAGQLPVRVRAEVVRVELPRRRSDLRQAGMGVRFLGLDPNVRTHLATVLRGLPPPLPLAALPTLRMAG
jgi:hypothetical protein